MTASSYLPIANDVHSLLQKEPALRGNKLAKPWKGLARRPRFLAKCMTLKDQAC